MQLPRVAGECPSRHAAPLPGLQDTSVEVVEGLQGTSLFLIGMMGSGKSTVGKLVAKALGYCFFDTGARRACACVWASKPA